MSRFFPNAKRSLNSLLNLITDLVADGVPFFRLMFGSRKALSAEVVFLRKQLALYQERQVQTETIERLRPFLSPPLVSTMQLENALVIVKPETLIGWHRNGFQLFWKWKSQAGRPRLPEGSANRSTTIPYRAPAPDG